MSDAYAKKVNQKPPLPPAAGRTHVLTITLQPDGVNVELSGPLNNDTLCYAMLEKARAHVQNMHLMAVMAAQAKGSNGSGLAGLMKKLRRG